MYVVDAQFFSIVAAQTMRQTETADQNWLRQTVMDIRAPPRPDEDAVNLCGG